MEDWERAFAAMALGGRASGGVMGTPVRRSGAVAALGLARRGEARFRSASPALSLVNGELPPQSPHFADISAREITEYRRTVRQYQSSRGTGGGSSGLRVPSDQAAAAGLLGDEMPPQSPLFADVPRCDIEGHRETIRKAKLARRNTTTAHQTAQSPTADPVAVSPRRISAAVERPRLVRALTQQDPSMTQQDSFRTPSRPSGRAGLLWTDADADDWILSQEPPVSPLFADYHSQRAEQQQQQQQQWRLRATSDVRVPDSSALLRAVGDAVAADLVRPGEIGELDGDHDRWFQVDVHSLFASPFSARSEPRVTVREVAVYDQASAPLVAVDADDPDVLAALERYLTLLSRRAGGSAAGAGAGRRRPTSLRVPSCNRLPPEIIDFHTPALSFMVRSKAGGGRVRRPIDRRVRAVDLEAMVEAYLPHVYAELDAAGSSVTPSPLSADGRGMYTRSPSESSIATLADPPSPAVRLNADDRHHAKTAQPKRQPMPPLCRALSTDSPFRSVAGAHGKMPEPMVATLSARRPLRAPVSTLNLKGALSAGASGRTGTLAQRARMSSPPGGAGAGIETPAWGVSPRSSVLSAASSRTSVVTDVWTDPGLRRPSIEQQRASPRSSNDQPAPLAFPRRASLASPASLATPRRRGTSTCSQATLATASRTAPRPAPATAGGLEGRPRTAPLRFSQPDMTPTRLPAPAAGRRPDVRQLFAKAQSSAAPERSAARAPPPPVQDAGERLAVRQRVGAKLMEFRSRIFPQ